MLQAQARLQEHGQYIDGKLLALSKYCARLDAALAWAADLAQRRAAGAPAADIAVSMQRVYIHTYTARAGLTRSVAGGAGGALARGARGAGELHQPGAAVRRRAPDRGARRARARAALARAVADTTRAPDDRVPGDRVPGGRAPGGLAPGAAQLCGQRAQR